MFTKTFYVCFIRTSIRTDPPPTHTHTHYRKQRKGKTSTLECKENSQNFPSQERKQNQKSLLTSKIRKQKKR